MPYNYIFQKPQLTIISSFSISFSEVSFFMLAMSDTDTMKQNA